MGSKRFFEHKGNMQRGRSTTAFSRVKKYQLFRQLSNLKVVGLAEQYVVSAGDLNDIVAAQLSEFLHNRTSYDILT